MTVQPILVKGQSKRERGGERERERDGRQDRGVIFKDRRPGYRKEGPGYRMEGPQDTSRVGLQGGKEG